MKAPLIARCNDGTATLNELYYLYDHDRQISFRTFAEHVDIKELSLMYGYAYGHEKGLHLKKDWAVRFYKSRFRGKRCYHMVWSEIDHIYQELSPLS
jgi:hypothetical protein